MSFLSSIIFFNKILNFEEETILKKISRYIFSQNITEIYNSIYNLDSNRQLMNKLSSIRLQLKLLYTFEYLLPFSQNNLKKINQIRESMNVEIKLYSSFNNFDRNEKERKNNIIKLLFKKTLNSIRYLFLFLFRIPVSIRNGILYPCPDQKFATIGVLFPVARDIFFFFFFSFHCSGP